MTKHVPNVDGIVPIFHVRDVAAAAAYYTDTLGFSQSFRLKTYVGLELGSCELHVAEAAEGRQVVGAGNAYAFCQDIDGYYAALKAAGAHIRSELQERAYGMRDFSVVDLDGNQLTFGSELDRV